MKLNILGCNIYISFPFWAFITLALITDITGTVLSSFISAILHELGHLAVMKHFNSMPVNIKLCVTDFSIEDKGNRSYREDYFVNLGGCAVNFLMSSVSFLLFFCFGTEAFKLFALSNIIMGFFNILPVKSLDGGKTLRLFLQQRWDAERIERIMTAVSLIIAVPCLIAGVAIFIYSGYNYSLMIISVYLIILSVKK